MSKTQFPPSDRDTFDQNAFSYHKSSVVNIYTYVFFFKLQYVLNQLQIQYKYVYFN
jgi:hypothetical protein